MPSKLSAQQARLAVSERTTLLYIAGGYSLPVTQLCERLGIPERTFYNYFATKAEAVKPVLERGIEALASTLASEPLSRPFDEVMLEGFTRSLWGEEATNTKAIVALVVTEPALYAVWLSTIRSFEQAVADAVRPRFGTEAGSIAEHMLAATLVSAVRITFEYVAEHGGDPAQVFRAALRGVELQNASKAINSSH